MVQRPHLSAPQAENLTRILAGDFADIMDGSLAGACVVSVFCRAIEYGLARQQSELALAYGAVVAA